MRTVVKWLSSLARETRGLLLLLAALPALVATIVALAKGHLSSILVNASGFSMYLLALALLRRGARGEAYLPTLLTRHRRPYKLLAAITTALATALLAKWGAGHSLALSGIFGFGAFLGMFLTYGFDPSASEAPAVLAAGGVDAQEVLRILEEAERRVANLMDASRSIKNAELSGRLQRIATLTRTILADLAENPRAIGRSRKFLNVYLGGIEKVVAGYARTHVHVRSEQLEENFRDVLTAIEETFDEQRRKLLENDVFDLDVQMEVLATQLKREGIV